MNQRIHPNHHRLTLLIIGILMIPVIVAFPLGFYFSNKYGGDSRQTFSCVLTVMVFGTLAFALTIARGFFCFCYQCKSLLLKQVKLDQEEETRKFICEKCQITWDSKIKIS